MPLFELMLMLTAVFLLTSTFTVPPPDFDTEVLPRLTKAGCNSAACHGAAAGRGGFRLSLFGGDPAADYDAIVREVSARRINLSKPERSLLLLKPTGELDHGGGLRFDGDSATAGKITAWIRSGAKRGSQRKLLALKLPKKEYSFARLPGQIQLKVQATFKHGSQVVHEDVTRLAVYQALDPVAVQVTSLGRLKLVRPGQQHVIVQFLNQVVVVTLWSPIGTAASKPVATGNFIDEEVGRTLARLRLGASPPASPSALLRRVTLDLTGRLPTVASFKQISGKQNWYESYVDSLLDSVAFNDYWTFRFAKLLRIQSQPQDRRGARTFHRWVRSQFRQRRGLDAMAVSLLEASGDSHQVGPANFYRFSLDPRKQAEFVSESLLGIRLRCANCHNHPLDRWTQDDYHGLAAIFARVQSGRVIRLKQSGSVIHPRTGERARARIPGEKFLPAGGDDRRHLARWLTRASNPYFSTAQTNRIWKALMGRGLYEPTDDLRETNPPTHPKLLRRLSRYFVAQDYDLRKLIRLIVTSQSYRRAAGKANRPDAKYYSHALRKPLAAEVLADAIVDVTGVPMRFGTEPLGTRAVQLFDSKIRSPSLDILGRCSRAGSCESEPAAAGGLAQTLHLINGGLLNDRIRDRNGRLQKLISRGRPVAEIVIAFYQAALSRPPSKRELAFWRKELSADSPKEQRQRLEDFVWSLLTSKDFRHNQ